jgi:hypothetical protein
MGEALFILVFIAVMFAVAYLFDFIVSILGGRK